MFVTSLLSLQFSLELGASVSFTHTCPAPSQTHKHIAIVWNPLQRKSSVRKTDSRHKLNLAFSVCNNDTVRAQLLNLYLFAAVLYRGGYIYIYTVFTLQCKFMPANIFQRATKLWVFLLRMPLSLSPLSVLSTLLSALSSYTQRHLGDALTKRVPNECGKWEYQFDELCYSISAINFPVALLSKMESRMIEPLFRYLILFLGSCLRACRACVSESVCAKKREALVKERDF